MIHIKENISLLPFNTFGIDVKAKYFCEIETIETLQELLKNDVFKTNQYLVLGGGSNILFSKDFDGLVIKNNIKGKSVIENNNEFAVIEAFAGEVWHELVLIEGGTIKELITSNKTKFEILKTDSAIKIKLQNSRIFSKISQLLKIKW